MKDKPAGPAPAAAAPRPDRYKLSERTSQTNWEKRVERYEVPEDGFF